MIDLSVGEHDIQKHAVLAGRDFWQEAGVVPPLPIPLDHILKMSAMYASLHLPVHHEFFVIGINYPQNRFLSTFLRFEEKTDILVHHKLNRCNTRFAVAIELAGIMFGAKNPSVTTTDIFKHLSGLRAGIQPDKDSPLYIEQLSPLVAIELLMPMYHRPTMDKFIADGAPAFDIADAFKVPQTVIEYLLDGGWADRCRLHRDIAHPPTQ